MTVGVMMFAHLMVNFQSVWSVVMHDVSLVSDAVPCRPKAATVEGSSLSRECCDWLRADEDLDALTLEWSRLEQSVRNPRKAVNASDRPLSRVAAEINRLDRSKANSLRRIVRSRATTAYEALQKLAVLQRLLEGEESPEHRLIHDALPMLAHFIPAPNHARSP